MHMNIDFHFTRYTGQKATLHHVTTMLATSENVLFSGHNHRYKPLLTTGTDDPGILIITLDGAQAVLRIPVITCG